MKKAVAFESRDVDVVASVIIKVSYGHPDAIHFHIQAAALRNIGERPIMVIAIQRRCSVPPAGSPVFPVHQKDIDPTVAIGIEERCARAEGLWEVFLSLFTRVMYELDARLSRDIGKLNFVRGRRGSSHRQFG
jgi:hypothetical protein